MVLAISASGPAAGGLSINTASANSIFGPSSGTTPAVGEMFGSTQASKPLFGAATTTTAPQTGGLFGTASGTTGAGLFGNTASQAPASGGLFGTATSQPQTGGLFGSSTAASQPPTGGLFGATSTTTSQPQTGGLFGTSQPQPQPQTQTSGGLFGGLGGTQSQNTGGRLFGMSQQNQNQCGGASIGLGNNHNQQNQNQNQNQNQGASVFGNNQQAHQNAAYSQAGSFIGGLTMGASNQGNIQQRAPGVYIDKENLRLTTRFDDLHENIKSQIELMDLLVQNQMARKGECDAILPAHANHLSAMPNDVEFCRRKLIGVETALTTDVDSIAHMQGLLHMDAENAKLSFKATDRLKLPSQYHTPGVWAKPANASGGQDGSEDEARDIVTFFSSTADEMATTLTKYEQNMKEIEAHLRTVEATTAQQVNSLVAKRNGASGSDGNAIGELASVLGEFQQGVLHVAGTIGAAREGMQTLQNGSFTGPGPRGTPVKGRRGGVY
ncbi:hypothetical protein BJ878DRAFT_415610 [Calycina marina]|uniref:Uncharacterized protein n=1 Tax=Calycina marina TaxID=1763456 RepID=A0A9P7Z7L2_9HELO|nr:hypothetical protein BJ878DRAFT_415610 [Calycina marina]